MAQLKSKRRLKLPDNQAVKHIILWSLFAIILRFTLIESFYQDNYIIKNWVTIGQILQTISLYYFFGYFVFPTYLYRFKFLPSLLWLLVWHIIIYESNYVFFWYIQQINDSSRIERDWNLFHNAGLLGCVDNGTAALWSFFYSFPFAMLLLTVQAIRDIIDLRTKNLRLEKDKLNLELDFLKTQVNPHFLFNTLNSIYADVFDTNEKAADLILRLSELMRYNLYETNLPRIPLDKELNYVQNYLNLERNRLSGQYVVIEYEQTGNPAAYQIAPLLLIAFVENAFKHGVKGASVPAYVQVSANVATDQLVFRVDNSVPARRSTVDAGNKSGGIGLVNVRKRLDALYKNQYQLVIVPGEEDYTVTLTIQIDVLTQEPTG